MKVTVCIGSSCHIKGSGRVLTQLQALLKEHNLDETVELASAFCHGNCQDAVCVTVDEEIYSVSPETVREFFEGKILAAVNRQ